MKYNDCPTCGEQHGRAYDSPVRCDACCVIERAEERFAEATADLRRWADIGRAVVDHLVGDDERARREATPERVCGWCRGGGR